MFGVLLWCVVGWHSVEGAAVGVPAPLQADFDTFAVEVNSMDQQNQQDLAAHVNREQQYQLQFLAASRPAARAGTTVVINNGGTGVASALQPSLAMQVPRLQGPRLRTMADACQLVLGAPVNNYSQGFRSLVTDVMRSRSLHAVACAENIPLVLQTRSKADKIVEIDRVIGHKGLTSLVTGAAAAGLLAWYTAARIKRTRLQRDFYNKFKTLIDDEDKRSTLLGKFYIIRREILDGINAYVPRRNPFVGWRVKKWFGRFWFGDKVDAVSYSTLSKRYLSKGETVVYYTEPVKAKITALTNEFELPAPKLISLFNDYYTMKRTVSRISAVMGVVVGLIAVSNGFSWSRAHKDKALIERLP